MNQVNFLTTEKINIGRLNKDSKYGEVVDTLTDAIAIGIVVERELQDGFQFQDILALLQVQPIINEIINDVPVFVGEFMNLNGTTAVNAVIEARERIKAQGYEFGDVTNFIIRSLYTLATSYKFGIEAYNQAQAQVLLFQNLVRGGAVFPDEFN